MDENEQTRPLYTLTVADFDTAVEAALEVRAELDGGHVGLLPSEREGILANVRRVVDYVSGDVDGWNSHFHAIVQDAVEDFLGTLESK